MRKRATLLLTEQVTLPPRLVSCFGFDTGGIETILPGLVDQQFIFNALGKRTYLTALRVGVLVPVRKRGTAAAKEHWWPWSEAWD